MNHTLNDPLTFLYTQTRIRATTTAKMKMKIITAEIVKASYNAHTHTHTLVKAGVPTLRRGCVVCLSTPRDVVNSFSFAQHRVKPGRATFDNDSISRAAGMIKKNTREIYVQEVLDFRVF